MIKLISIILPVYNESVSLHEFFLRLNEVLKNESAYIFEFIFVNDGSADNSLSELLKIKAENKQVKILDLTRNFGKEMALTAGLLIANGEACLMLDSDLQHPPELIPEFLKKWEKGAEVVVGVRNKNKKESKLKRFGSFLFYNVMKILGNKDIVQNATDYRLVDKLVLDFFKKFTEHQRMTRGLIDWLGFKTEYIYFDCGTRKSGSQPSYGFFKLFRLAISTFASYSLLPLKVAGYLGIVITLFSGSFGLFIFVEKFILKDPWNFNFSGPAMLAILTIFLVGIVLICLGLVAIYIAQIHGEVINRPLFVTRKIYN